MAFQTGRGDFRDLAGVVVIREAGTVVLAERIIGVGSGQCRARGSPASCPVRATTLNLHPSRK